MQIRRRLVFRLRLAETVRTSAEKEIDNLYQRDGVGEGKTSTLRSRLRVCS